MRKRSSDHGSRSSSHTLRGSRGTAWLQRTPEEAEGPRSPRWGKQLRRWGRQPQEKLKALQPPSSERLHSPRESQAAAGHRRRGGSPLQTGRAWGRGGCCSRTNGCSVPVLRGHHEGSPPQLVSRVHLGLVAQKQL